MPCKTTKVGAGLNFKIVKKAINKLRAVEMDFMEWIGFLRISRLNISYPDRIKFQTEEIKLISVNIYCNRKFPLITT